MNQTKAKIMEAITLMADTVKVTLGTKGRLVLYRKFRDFDDKTGFPVLTKDGVTVAKQLETEDEVVNLIMQVIREASQKTVDSSGDGTTTTMILAQELIVNGFILLEDSTSSWQFNKETDIAVQDICTLIEEVSTSVQDNIDLLENVATISANDEEIGQLIASIIDEIGFYGDIDVKESNNYYTEVELVPGLKINKGYFAPFFCNNIEKLTWEATNVNILVFDDTIRDYADIQEYVKASVDENEAPVPLLIYCQDIATTVLNRIKGMMEFNPRLLMIVEQDGFGDRRIEITNDICLMSGARAVDASLKVKSANAAKYLGFCKEVYVDNNFTSFVGMDYDATKVNKEIEAIRRRIANSNPSLNEKRYLEKRMANLSGGIAIINVGGRTKVEMKESYWRMEDAVLATKSAISKGVVVGGAYTWEKISVAADELAKIHQFNRSKNPSYFLVFDSLKSILKQLLTNSDSLSDLNKIRDVIINNNKGYNLIDRQFYDIEDYTVYDAASVLMDSITNAVTVAQSILSIERIICNNKVTI